MAKAKSHFFSLACSDEEAATARRCSVLQLMREQKGFFWGFLGGG